MDEKDGKNANNVTLSGITLLSRHLNIKFPWEVELLNYFEWSPKLK